MGKTLYLVGGAMGVGKTTVCREMQKELDNCVLLDGDWCWDARPFVVTEETKQMVMDNISFVLNRFLRCSAYKNVVFCWVMDEQSIIDKLLSRLDLTGVIVQNVSLVCREDTLRQRLGRDVDCGVRTVDVIERSIGRLPKYAVLDTRKVVTDGKSAKEICKEVIIGE